MIQISVDRPVARSFDAELVRLQPPGYERCHLPALGGLYIRALQLPEVKRRGDASEFKAGHCPFNNYGLLDGPAVMQIACGRDSDL